MEKTWIHRLEKSLRAGFSSYKSTANAIGLLSAMLGSVSFLQSIFHLQLSRIAQTIVETYHSILVIPLQSAFVLTLDLHVPSWFINVLYVYLLIGGAITRTRLNHFKAHTFQTHMEYSTAHNLLGQRHPAASWRSYLFLVCREGRLRYQTPQQRPDIWYRLDLFYRFSPRVLRLSFDLLFWPLAFILLLQRPLLVEIDNRQNPEDNGPAFWSLEEFNRFRPWPSKEDYWMNAAFVYDYRYFFLAQILGLTLSVLAFLSVNAGVDLIEIK